MRFNYFDNKGVLMVKAGDTHNTLPYSDDKGLIELVDRILNKQKLTEIQIVDFERKCVFLVADNEDFEELKENIGGKE